MFMGRLLCRSRQDHLDRQDTAPEPHPAITTRPVALHHDARNLSRSDFVQWHFLAIALKAAFGAKAEI